MASNGLTLVGRGSAGSPTEAIRPGRPLMLSGVIALAVVFSAITGTRPARQPVDARQAVADVATLAMEQGASSPEVRETLVALRTALGKRPLDSRTRVAYAALLFSISRSIEEIRVATEHARRAATLAPVTVPVIRRATHILASGGERDEALGLVREMFGYSPREAAELLADVMPVLYENESALALPDRPAAWLAWSRELQRRGRVAEAARHLEIASRRWPEDLATLRFVAEQALRDGNRQRLDELFPQEREFPETAEAAPLLACRARHRAETGGSVEAEADIETAIRLGGDSTLVRVLVGDAFAALGRPADARRQWNRALFLVESSEANVRRNLLVKLARLEEGTGNDARALRYWVQVLEVDPEHAEARRRQEQLTDY